MGAPFRTTTGGIELYVRLTPKSSKDDVKGLREYDGKVYVEARVRAVPEDGKANRAITELVAARLGVPRSSIVLASGQSSRLKTLAISGDAKALCQKVEEWLKGFA